MNLGSADLSPTPYMRASRIRVAYRFGKTSIEVDIDDPDVARWLAEFFTPWFSIKASTGTGLRVRVTSSREQFSALNHREMESKLQQIPCFGLDSKLISLPGWIESDGTTLIADKELGCYYRLQGNQVDVISRPQDRQARIGLMRVLRELATSRAFALIEMLDLHAAAFVFRGRAILLAGDKNIGKTTLLAHALTSCHTALMANDRVIIDVSRLQTYGVPTIVSVRNETEQTFPMLSNMMPRRAFLFHEGELASIDFAQVGAKRLLALSPVQFGRQMGSRVEPWAPVGAILFPQISSSIPTLSLRPLDPSDAVACLRTSLYGSRSAARSNTIFQKIATALPDSDARNSLLDQLATAVPLIRCVLGKNAYDESADDWLKTLPLAGGMAQR
jgi:hypothetical protein